MMLKLTYYRKDAKYQRVTVLGDAEGIRDLFWQLTHNYRAVDGTEIGDIVISNLEGTVISHEDLMRMPLVYSTYLSSHMSV
jgi:hypothetical protein